MRRYTAHFLFQFRVEGDTRRRRTCEESLFVFKARSARNALQAAQKTGKKKEFRYRNSDGAWVYFEFVGILDLLDLSGCDDNEVWYDIREYVAPMERRKKLIPPTSSLQAIMVENSARQPKKGKGRGRRKSR